MPDLWLVRVPDDPRPGDVAFYIVENPDPAFKSIKITPAILAKLQERDAEIMAAVEKRKVALNAIVK